MMQETNNMVKVDQTLHMGGQYGSEGEPSVLYFTHFHQYGHIWWRSAGGSQGPHSPLTAPHLDVATNHHNY